jgi:hypothetical protein
MLFPDDPRACAAPLMCAQYATEAANALGAHVPRAWNVPTSLHYEQVMFLALDAICDLN